MAIERQNYATLVITESNTALTGVKNTPAEDLRSTLLPYQTEDPEIPQFIKFDFNTRKVQFVIDPSRMENVTDIMQEINTGTIAGATQVGCIEMILEDCSSPQVCTERGSAEWEYGILLKTCGWPPETTLEASIVSVSGLVSLPQPEPRSHSSQAGFYDYYYVIELNTPPGAYVVTITDGKSEVSSVVDVKVPDRPRVFLHKGDFLLYGFRANESVRFAAYSESEEGSPWSDSVNTLISWDQFNVDEKGQLYVEQIVAGEYSQIKAFILDSENNVVYGSGPFDTHGPVVSPYGVSVTRPSIEEIKSVPDLWNEVGGLVQDGGDANHSYRVVIRRNSTWRWGFRWCEESEEELIRILDRIYVHLSIDGESLYSIPIEEYDHVNDSGQYCHRWDLLVFNLLNVQQVELAAKVMLHLREPEHENEIPPPYIINHVINVEVVE